MTANLFTTIPENLPEELTTVLQAGGSFRIERIISHRRAWHKGIGRACR